MHLPLEWKRQSESAVLHPCAFFSKKLTPAEQNYDNGNRVLLAIRLALRQVKWALFFTRFQFKVTYHLGHKNTKADDFSHLHSPDQPPQLPDPTLPPALFACAIQWVMDEDCYSLQRVASCTRRSCGRTFVPSTLCVSGIRASRLPTNPLAPPWTYWATNNAAHAPFPEPSDTFQKACCNHCPFLTDPCLILASTNGEQNSENRMLPAVILPRPPKQLELFSTMGQICTELPSLDHHWAYSLPVHTRLPTAPVFLVMWAIRLSSCELLVPREREGVGLSSHPPLEDSTET